MTWHEVRARYPNEWLVIEAVKAHSDGHSRVLDRVAVVEPCTDGAAAFRRYRELHLEHPDRELYFVHTGNVDLEIDDSPWVGIRSTDAAHSSR